eukprot:XP_011673961.1 PREDICTED: rhodopsin, GQ-coupled-like [Strongylocentrotus purpuratus]
MDPIEKLTVDKKCIPFHHRAIVASVLIGLTLIGLFGNTLVIIAVVVTKKLRTITNILVVNLAFADLVTCLCIPFQVVGLLSQAEGYPLRDFVCATVAGVFITCICCSSSTLALISIVRWFVITKFVRGQRGFHSPKKIAALVVIIWIVSVALMVVPPLLGIGTLGYSQYYSLCCTTDTNPLNYYYVTIQGTVVAVNLTLTLMFYILIWLHVLQHNKHFRDKYDIKEENSSHAAQSKDSSVSRESCPPMIQSIKRKEIQITKNLFMVVCVFVFCFLATSIYLLIPGTSVFTFYSIMLLSANSVVNPIIYGLKHPNFQEVFQRTFRCVWVYAPWTIVRGSKTAPGPDQRQPIVL